MFTLQVVKAIFLCFRMLYTCRLRSNAAILTADTRDLFNRFPRRIGQIFTNEILLSINLYEHWGCDGGGNAGERF